MQDRKETGNGQYIRHGVDDKRNGVFATAWSAEASLRGQRYIHLVGSLPEHWSPRRDTAAAGKRRLLQCWTMDIRYKYGASKRRRRIHTEDIVRTDYVETDTLRHSIEYVLCRNVPRPRLRTLDWVQACSVVCSALAAERSWKRNHVLLPASLGAGLLGLQLPRRAATVPGPC